MAQIYKRVAATRQFYLTWVRRKYTQFSLNGENRSRRLPISSLAAATTHTHLNHACRKDAGHKKYLASLVQDLPDLFADPPHLVARLGSSTPGVL